MSTPKRNPVATELDIQRAVNLRALGKNSGEIARDLKRPRQTVEGWLRRADLEGVKPGAAKVNEHEQERIRLQDRIRDLDGQIKAIHRDNLTAEVVRRQIVGLAEMSPQPPRWLIGKQARKSTGVPCVLWSDWHWGEVVDSAQIDGVNSYDLATAQARARALVEKVIYLYRNHVVHSDCPGLVLNLGGDMISGDIHDELSETNELPTMPVLLDLYGVLIWAIAQLADAFGRVFVPCVPGNHGRNTHRPRFKNRAYSNFDWLLYCFLEKHFAADERVQFYVPVSADASYSVLGHRFLLTHGDNLGVKGGDGIIGSLGPILRGDFKIRNAASAIEQPYDTLLMGHWHQYLALRRVIVNGCLKGFDEFAKLALRTPPEPPAQAFWMVSESYGIIENRPIYVEKPKKQTSTIWAAWPQSKVG